MEDRWKIEFKDKMDTFKEPVPESLWDDISNSMATYSFQKKKSIFPYLKTAGIAAAIFGGVMIMEYFQAGEHLNQPERILIADSECYFRADAWEKMPSAPAPIILKEHPIRQETNIIHYAGKTGQENETESVEKPEESVKDNKKEDGGHPYTVSMPEDAECDLSLVPDYEKANKTGRRKHKFSISATVSGNSGGTDRTSGYEGTPAANAAAVTSFGANPEADIRLFNRTREVSTDTKYAQPVRAGVYFRWYFSQRWSLESGLAWTWLHSLTTSGSAEYYSSTTKDMHYIGIPVRLNCDFWSGKNMKAYASAEAMAEKCIAGKSVSEYFYNGFSGPQEKANISERPIQWSLSAHAGFQYDFTNTIGVYAEPGISWHIDNGSGIDNVYKSRPVGFSIGAGLRFSF